jgi:ribosome-binding protein aMBF1 (putative translation factor)
MSRSKSLSEWMAQRGLAAAELAEAAGLDVKVVAAIAAGRYTTSPQQRQRLARALGVSETEVRWGQPLEVEHLYGHGPQFGRSP